MYTYDVSALYHTRFAMALNWGGRAVRLLLG